MVRKQLQENTTEVCATENGLKLLLVDEDAADLDYYSEVLRHLGYDVRPVESYAQAAATLGCERFDLVIVEQGSTDFKGRAVLTRAVEVDRHVPVLVLARSVDADCCIEALDTGAREYVQKPLTTAELRDLVGDYVKPSAEVSVPTQKFPIGMGLLEGNCEGTAHEAWRKAS